MEIRETLPFDFCNQCKEFILDVDETTVYADDGIMVRILAVSCKHRGLCEKLKENIERVGKGEK
jgi:hypothetical protein